jgi:hypothetical protein
MDEVREGNVVDRMYLWSLGTVPKAVLQRMLQRLEIGPSEVLVEKFGPKAQIFQLECSYGAHILAVVEHVEIGGAS